jgi:Kef-type K+ transport system membrane component KefB
MTTFLSGMITAGFLVAALFFFRFWKRTGDSLFAIFGISFLLFAAGQSISVSFDFLQDDKTWVYVLRLVGFVLLLAAIARKNVGKSKV